MPKKRRVKNKSFKINPFLKTRVGFYLLSATAIILMFSIVKLIGSYNAPQEVLGNNSDGGTEERRKKEEQKARHEKKKEEIRQEFRVEPDKIKVKFESRDGTVKRKIEIENEELDLDDDKEEDLGDDIEDEFEEEHESEIASEGGTTIIKNHKVKARSGFPLSIDVATNQLIVTRPDGTIKIVSILPDQAVQNFMRHKKVNLLNTLDDSDGSGSGELNDDNASSSGDLKDKTQVAIVEHKNQLVYEIKGKKKLNLLGFIPVTTQTTGFVSTTTGEVVDQEESLFTQFLNFLSF